MATTKFKLRASTVSGKQGTLIIQVIHKRVVRQLSTKYKLYPEEWDSRRQSVVIHEHTATHRCCYLQAVHEAVQHDASRLQLIILTFDHSRKNYHAEDGTPLYCTEFASWNLLADLMPSELTGATAMDPVWNALR